MVEAMVAGSGAIDAGMHVYPVRVYYDDTDAGGVVYYANFLKMAERARTELLRLIGAEHAILARDEGVMLAVRRCEVDYLRPARLDDALQIRTKLLDIGGASLWAEQVVRRGDVELARLKLRIACVTLTGRAARIPSALRAALQPFVNHDAARP